MNTTDAVQPATMTEGELFAKFLDEKFVRRGKSGRINRSYYPSIALAGTSDYDDVNEVMERIVREAESSDDPAQYLINAASELQHFVNMFRMVAFDFPVFKDRLERADQDKEAA